eukprot:3550974-Rhodomonas_salina.2
MYPHVSTRELTNHAQEGASRPSKTALCTSRDMRTPHPGIPPSGGIFDPSGPGPGFKFKLRSRGVVPVTVTGRAGPELL